MNQLRDADVDVVVVGGGNAGLTAVLAALEAGVSVTLIEANDVARRGGNSRCTGSLFRFVYDSFDDVLEIDPAAQQSEWERSGSSVYSKLDYLADLERLGNGQADPVLTNTYIDESRSTMKWMSDSASVPWEYQPMRWEVPNPGAVMRSHGDGIALVEALYVSAEAKGARIEYEAFCDTWSLDADGVLVEYTRHGETHRLRARALVLASGGFEANAEKRARYLGQTGGILKVRGTRFNTGRMLDVALEAGALATGDWTAYHATPVDLASDEEGEATTAKNFSRHSYPFGIMLNVEGDRFVDEGEDFSLFTYAKMGKAIAVQTRALAFQIFDAESVKFVDSRYPVAEAPVADTLEELFEKLATLYRLDAGRALESVKRFNSATDSTLPFDPMEKDRKGTSGLSPDKTNWALPLGTAPFYAFPVTGGITFSYGGLAIDEDARVQGVNKSPMERLFATGEITGGFFYDNYPAGAGLMRGAVFGRRAGIGAAAWASRA